MISIIIPVYNEHEMTNECLRSVERTMLGYEYEIMVIDNGSGKPFVQPEEIDDCFVFRNEENLGFPKAVNQGIRVTKGDLIVLLNNDVILTRNWFEPIKRHLEKFAIVAPVTNYAAGMQRVTIGAYKDIDELNRQAFEHQTKHDFQAQEVNWIIGFCFLFRRSLYDDLGEFDESLFPCSGEEIDFCLRAKAAGYKIAIAKDVYVHHSGSVTFKAMHEAKELDYPAICERDTKHLEEKWGKIWEKQEVG